MHFSRSTPFLVGTMLVVAIVACGTDLWRARFAQEPFVSTSAGRLGVTAERESLNVLVPVTLETAVARAVEKYRVVPLKLASDYFHRWRFDARSGPYRVNRQLQIEMNRLLRRDEFRKTFPFSRPLVFRSPFGWEVRQRTPSEGAHRSEFEYHLDQLLAACAEVEAPLGLSIDTESGAVTIGELLDASRRNFERSQELYWTLVAYCGYLPEEAHWTNRFGESCSYESMVGDILSKSPDEGSCGGTHKQYALAYLLSRSASGDILTADLRRRCEDYLRRSSETLENTQLANGAWSPSWAKLADAESGSEPLVFTVEQLVRITGHHLEWICLAPRRLRPSDSAVSAAIRFLATAIDRADLSAMQKDYCAYSHAACVLARFVSRRTQFGRGVQPEPGGDGNPRGNDQAFRQPSSLELKRAHQLVNNRDQLGNRSQITAIDSSKLRVAAPK
ncbi:MAG TPA: hypothetical protein VMR25_13265 [Planctomycetaceae bacterium]|jgi:hypothetical protein|nr:hypothetical protein [Planctomycetaceae bacterium]